MTTTQQARSEASFTRLVTFATPPALVFKAITTLDGLRGWWTPFVEGDAVAGGDVRFEFEGLSGQHVIMHVDEAVAGTRATIVRWTCLIHSALPEWKDTQIVWELRPVGGDHCELRLEHVGLTPNLDASCGSSTSA